jgi:putative SOS response-associated peptidase YedK
MPGVYPDYPAPVVRNTEAGRELAMMRWGMPPPPRTGGFPVTNIRNTSSPHWRGWLKPENRCVVPANSFAEYAPAESRHWQFGLRGTRTGPCFPLRVSGLKSGATAAPNQSRSPGLIWSMAS